MEIPVKGVPRREAIATAFLICGLLMVTALGVHRLAQFPYYPRGLDVRWALDGTLPLLPVTGWAAIKVWLFWGTSTVVIGGLLLAFDPELGLCDAILAGAAGLWVLAYLLGNIFGPIGLFRGPLIWLLLAAGALWLWHLRPRIPLRAPSTGQKLALLAFALMALITLPAELGSPVVPALESLNWPSSAQRVLTFGTYAPLNNAPYGAFEWRIQAPATELFYASLALGTHTRFALLAESAAVIPVLGLLVFSAYRLGYTFFDDLAGGFAALLLPLAAFPNAMMQGMRPAATAFMLGGIGLGFFLDSRRSRTRMALGAVLLGVLIPSYVIHGALGLGVAMGGVVIWFAWGDISRLRAGIGCLAGAVLIGASEFLVAFQIPSPYPILPATQLAGIALILVCVAGMRPDSTETPRMPHALALPVLALLMVVLVTWYWIGVPFVLPGVALFWNFPLRVLTILGAAGLIVLLIESRAGSSAPAYAGLAACAIALCPAAKCLSSLLIGHVVNHSWQYMLFDGSGNLSYGSDYFLTLLAALPCAYIWTHFSKAIALLAISVALLYPWQVTDPNQRFFHWRSESHSLTEQFAYNLELAAQGYWGKDDPRWSMGTAGFALVDVLKKEIDAGRITMATHVLHPTPGLGRRYCQYSAFTGINDDPLLFLGLGDPRNDIFVTGSRMRPFGELRAALAEHPPYILDQRRLAPGVTYPGYEEIFRDERLHLFRRRDLSPAKGSDAATSRVLPY